MKKYILLGCVLLLVVASVMISFPKDISRTYTVGVFNQENEWIEDIKVQYGIQFRRGIINGNWYSGFIQIGDETYIVKSSRTKLLGTTLGTLLHTKIQDIRREGYMHAMLVDGDMVGYIEIDRNFTTIYGASSHLKETYGDKVFFKYPKEMPVIISY